MSAHKTIKRTTPAAARAAMAAHAARMAGKGWAIEQEFEGDTGRKYECITYFYKPATAADMLTEFNYVGSVHHY